MKIPENGERGGIGLLVTSLGRLPARRVPSHNQRESSSVPSPPLEGVLPWEMGIVRHSWCRNVRGALRTFSRSRPGHPRFPSPAFVRPSVRQPNSEYGSVGGRRAGERRGFPSRPRSHSLSLSLVSTLAIRVQSARSVPQWFSSAPPISVLGSPWIPYSLPLIS